MKAAGAVDELILVEDLKVSAYKIPTDLPESDGTLKWDSTTLILVEIEAGDLSGIGYTYADASAAYFIEHTLKYEVISKNAMDIPAITDQLIHAIRNNGQSGIAMMAVSAIDVALWDLKAKLLDTPLSTLLGRYQEDVLLYASGGFTSYSDFQLQRQLRSWKESGFENMKIKIGRNTLTDINHIKLAREVIGPDVRLFVDANAAYTPVEAIKNSEIFYRYDVSWLEEPVAADYPEQLSHIRNHMPPGIQIAAGEYGYRLTDLKRLLDHRSVDVLQADATRCGGITGFLKAGHLAEAYAIPFSSHCAPSIHIHAALSLNNFYIAEYFYDHVRIEQMFFGGTPLPKNGRIHPHLDRPGLGIEFRRKDAEPYKI